MTEHKVLDLRDNGWSIYVNGTLQRTVPSHWSREDAEVAARVIYPHANIHVVDHRSRA